MMIRITIITLLQLLLPQLPLQLKQQVDNDKLNQKRPLFKQRARIRIYSKSTLTTKSIKLINKNQKLTTVRNAPLEHSDHFTFSANFLI